jgi:hypothetical protein
LNNCDRQEYKNQLTEKKKKKKKKKKKPVNASKNIQWKNQKREEQYVKSLIILKT